MTDAPAGRPASADDVRVSWSLFRDERDRTPEPIAGTFGEVAPGLFDRVAIRAGKSGRAWSPTTYADGATRGNGGVVAISAVVLDFDHGGTPERARQRVVELGLAAWIHSTHSSTPENPRFRLIVPLVDHVPAAEWPGVWPRARAHLDPDGLSDSATGDPSRIYFLPSARPEYPSFTYRVSGRALRLDELPPATADPRRLGDTPPAIASRDLPPAVGTAELLARVGGFSADGPLFRRLLETIRGEPRAHSTNLVLSWVLHRCGATEAQIAELTEWPISEVRSTLNHFRAVGAYSYSIETLRRDDPIFARVEREALAAAASAREAGTTDAGVPLTMDGRGNLRDSVRVNPDSGALEIVRWSEKEPVGRRVVIPGPFRARAVTDETGARMYAFAGLGDGGEEFRDYADAAVLWLARRFALTGGDRHAAALFLAEIPAAGRVSSRLALVLRDGELARVERPFAASTGGRGSAPAIVDSWYRPRPRDRALAGLEKLRTFMATANAKLRTQYVAGAPVFSALFPDSLLPSLIETGAAGSGKTLGERATVAVLWGLSAGDGETLTRDVLGSAFRSSAFADATNLPLIVDEAQAGSRAERERHRATASGGVATRGGTDLRLRAYRHRAPIIRNGNAGDDTVELTDSEAGGEGRRQIRVNYGTADADAIAPKRAEFQRFLADLANGPTDESGGGAALWLLRARLEEEPGLLDRLRRLAAEARDERAAVVAIGAKILGETAAAVPEPPAPESGEAFLGWLQARVAEWFAERGAGKIPRAIGTMRPLVEASPLSDPEGIEQQHRTRFVAVSRETLREYREALRRGGRESPFSALSDLEALSGLTGQTADAMLGKVEAGRTARRGVLVKLPRTAPAAVRCAIVQLPPTDEEGDEADEKKDDAEGKGDETEGDAARKRERDSDAHRPEGEGYEGYGRVTNTTLRDTEREREVVTLVTPVTPVCTSTSEAPLGGIPASSRVTNPPADVKSGNPREGYGQGYGLPGGGNTPPSPPRAADPPRPDPGRLEAATRELADLVRSVGTADRDVIHRVLGANYSPAEISSAIGSVCASGLVRQEPNGSLSWKEAGP